MITLRSFLLLVAVIFVPAVNAETLTLGVINEREDKPDHAYMQYGQFHSYLKKQLAELDISLKPLMIARDVNHMTTLIADGEIDMFIEGVMPTLSIQEQTGIVKESLLAWRKGQRQYYTVFFVRKDSGIDSLDDLQNKTIAFESPRSTSAYFVPRAALVASGFELMSGNQNDQASGKRIYYQFSESELNQSYWVLKGRVDVAAFNDGDWERVPDSVRQDLKIIYETRPVLRWLFSYVDDVSQENIDKINEVLLNMHLDDSGKGALEKAARITRFETLKPDDLANMAYWRTVFEELE